MLRFSIGLGLTIRYGYACISLQIRFFDRKQNQKILEIPIEIFCEKELINDINKIFKDENNKCILISLLYGKLRKFLKMVDEKEQKELIKNNENALEELKHFYPSIQILINSLSNI